MPRSQALKSPDARRSHRAHRPNPMTQPKEWLDHMIEHPPAGSIVVDVTPELAAAMMSHNGENRPPSRRKISMYEQDMREGKWMLTGEAIIFSDVGVLNTGQQRLQACINTGTTFKSDVRFGIDRKAHVVTDTGKAKSASDTLRTVGHSNANTLSAALMWKERWDRGSMGRSLSDRLLTNRMLMELALRHPEMEESVDVARKLYREIKGFPPGLLAFAHWLFRQKDADAADQFYNILIKGIGFKNEDDPIYRLRKRMIERASQRSTLTPIDMLGVMVKAWNYWRRGEKVEYLAFRSYGKNPEQMAQPV